jgi:cell division septation protein DedD
VANKLYRVQIGAYREKANAEAMLAKLKKAGFDGYIKDN